jgi:hypothetical protein
MARKFLSSSTLLRQSIKLAAKKLINKQYASDSKNINFCELFYFIMGRNKIWFVKIVTTTFIHIVVL